MQDQAVIRIRVLLHGIFWMIYVALSTLVGSKLVAPFDAFLRTLVGLGILAAAVYFVLLVLVPRYFQPRRHVFFFSSLLVVVICTIFLRNWVDHWLLWQHAAATGVSLLDQYGLLITITSTLTVLAVVWGYWFAEQAYLSRMHQLAVEREKVKAERDFLRTQINPHFLFNTLNNLYSLALAKSERMPEVVLKLSELMRYMLYDAADSWVLLEAEMNHMRNLIELQQLKTREAQNISLEVRGAPGSFHIAPMLLVSLLENSLKHSDVQQGGRINMQFRIEQNQLSFQIKNSLPQVTEIAPSGYSGIGLQNLRKRLDLLYPGQHQFSQRESEDHFRVQLTIPLR